MRNQKHTAQRREIKTNRVVSKTTESQKQTKENRKYVKSLIQIGYKEKQLGGVILRSKLTLNHPSDKKMMKKKGVTTRV